MNEHVFVSEIYLLTKPNKDAVNVVLKHLQTVTTSVLAENFQDDVPVFLKSLSKNLNLEGLLYTQVIDKIEILFEGECGLINMNYDLNEKDNLDISILKTVPIKTDQVEIKLWINNLKLAKDTGMQDQEKNITQHLKLSISDASIPDNNASKNGAAEKIAPEDLIDSVNE